MHCTTSSSSLSATGQEGTILADEVDEDLLCLSDECNDDACQGLLIENLEVIRLSAATQELPRSAICNVHGVNPKFLDVGVKKEEQQNDNQAFTKDAYYIGKKLWSKGYKELLKLLSNH
nr:digalactosyldiacylglycerol synthase 2, chloroplastic-like [Ipomoea batatas]